MEFEDHEEEDEMEIETTTNCNNHNSNNNNKPLSRLNKNPSPVHTNRPHPLSTKPPYNYKECLKNHAVAVGGHALDGCGEFMPAGPDGSLDALKCAACNCHRNFHRKDIITIPNGNRDQSPFVSCWHAPTGYLHVAPQRQMLALPSPAGDDGSGSRKRLRTKFTEEQKEKMVVMAEKLDWRIQKSDEAAVMEFCSEIGVKRRVLKVWMHNNKNTFRKESQEIKFS